MSQVKKIITPDLEKSFSKKTDGMKHIISSAITDGTIKIITNRAGRTILVGPKTPDKGNK